MLPRRLDAPTTATELGPEERLERGAHGDVVARRDLLAVRRRRRDREADLDLAAVGDARDVEACVAEDGHHRVVVVQHLGDELLDARLGGAGGELLEEARADPALLEAVVDGERDLGDARVAQPHPVRERHVRPSSEPTRAPRSSQSGSSTGSTSFGPSAGKPWKRR